MDEVYFLSCSAAACYAIFISFVNNFPLDPPFGKQPTILTSNHWSSNNHWQPYRNLVWRIGLIYLFLISLRKQSYICRNGYIPSRILPRTGSKVPGKSLSGL